MSAVAVAAHRDQCLPETRSRHAAHARLRSSFPKARRQNFALLPLLLFIMWSDVAGSHGRHLASMAGREKRCPRMGDVEKHAMSSVEGGMANEAQERHNGSREGMKQSPQLIQELKRRWAGRLTEVLRGGGSCMSTCRWVCRASGELLSECANLGASPLQKNGNIPKNDATKKQKFIKSICSIIFMVFNLPTMAHC
jgi:hypothetical protein